MSDQPNVTIELPAVIHEAILRRAEKKNQTFPEFLLETFGEKPVEPIISVEQLVEMSMRPRVREFTVNGQKYSFEVKALSAEQSHELDKIEGAIIAPRDPRTQMPNTDDPNYLAQIAKARRVKRAMAIGLCVRAIKLPGDTLQEQADWLYKNLPSGLIEEIWGSIYTLTAEPVENALFT